MWAWDLRTSNPPRSRSGRPDRSFDSAAEEERAQTDRKGGKGGGQGAAKGGPEGAQGGGGQRPVERHRDPRRLLLGSGDGRRGRGEGSGSRTGRVMFAPHAFASSSRLWYIQCLQSVTREALALCRGVSVLVGPRALTRLFLRRRPRPARGSRPTPPRSRPPCSMAPSRPCRHG